MSKYEEKKAARLERYKQYAENAAARSTQAFDQAGKMASCIPMGQPILVGHHSERADRNFRDRIHNKMGKGVEEGKKAEYWENRADSAESNRSIDSDDPEAISKLNDKSGKLEALSADMKRINKEFKKGVKFTDIKMTDELRESAMNNFRFSPGGTKQPFPTYQLSSIRARIKTAKKRTEVIERAVDFQGFEANGISVELNEGQIQVRFPGKPNEETRAKLKSWPASLKWSGYEKAWVRKYTGQGEYWAEELKKILASVAY